MIRYIMNGYSGLLYLIFLGVITVGGMDVSHASPPVLTAKDVLSSSAHHFPEIKIALEKIRESRGQVQQAKGAFDTTINGKYYDRYDGYYSGGLGQIEIVQPLAAMNTKLYSGYRASDGDFPIYEDYYVTNDEGEASVGLALSLLKNRDIDPRRFDLFQSNRDLDLSNINLLKTQFNVQQRAYNAYLEWVAAGLELNVYQQLLAIAEDRQLALTEQARQGDIPDIATVENKQFILQRREILLEVERKLKNAANALSLFYRDDMGVPIIVTDDLLPTEFPLINDVDIETAREGLNQFILNNPVIRETNVEKNIANQQYALGKNDMLPMLDLTLEAADDFGDEFASRSPFESTVKLDLSIPLQRRIGRGKVVQAKAKQQQADLKKNLAIEKLTIQFDNIFNNITAARNILNVTREEIDVTKRMENAERSMFTNGQSNFFLVNIREVNTVKAKINNINAQKYLASVYADFYALTLDRDAFVMADNIAP